jgi:hypothetical protein
MRTPERVARAAMHAVAAAVFFFLLQRFGLGQTLQESVSFAVFFAAAAAGLSWYQTSN